MEIKKIGFVGIGLMGHEMVKNLLEGGYSVTGYDVDPDKIKSGMGMGAEGVQAPEELPGQADVIFLSLPNSHVVDDVVENATIYLKTEGKDKS